MIDTSTLRRDGFAGASKKKPDPPTRKLPEMATHGRRFAIPETRSGARCKSPREGGRGTERAERAESEAVEQRPNERAADREARLGRSRPTEYGSSSRGDPAAGDRGMLKRDASEVSIYD